MPSHSGNQKKKPANKGTVKAVQTPSVPKPKNMPEKKRDLWTITDGFFLRYQGAVLVISVMLSVILGIFLFDVKISTVGDDSHYIEMANEFLKGRAFPSWHGPLYSIFLSLPILLFGVNVIWLKVFSF